MWSKSTGSKVKSQGELDGVYKQFHWGVVSWSGTNGTSDNGISIEVYTGPMFRSYSRTWTADVPLTSGSKKMRRGQFGCTDF